MSSDARIDIRGLSKRYTLYDTAHAQLLGQFSDRVSDQYAWALKDINLTAEFGETIGLIGENGAGKSTLLQVLAGIVSPTSGSVDVTGRVAAMLELGAGFNPDFSGIENARLSGVIYGLSPREIEARLPKICEFAGIGDYINRPTRQYSSGMFARLAFAVAAHIDADILIVDEILNVGDISFQQKAMRFLREFSKTGLVFFASHDLAAVTSLCDRVVLLEKGEIVGLGKPRQMVHEYMKRASRKSDESADFAEDGALVADGLDPVLQDDIPEGLPFLDFEEDTPPVAPGKISAVSLTVDGRTQPRFAGGEIVALECRFAGGDAGAVLAFAIRDRLGEVVCYRDTSDDVSLALKPTSRQCAFGFRLPYFLSGTYTIDVGLFEEQAGEVSVVDVVRSAATFEVISNHIGGGIANVPHSEAVIEVVA